MYIQGFMDDPLLWAALTTYKTQSTQEIEDEGTCCKQFITSCRAWIYIAGVWHGSKEAYEHMHPPPQTAV